MKKGEHTYRSSITRLNPCQDRTSCYQGLDHCLPSSLWRLMDGQQILSKRKRSVFQYPRGIFSPSLAGVHGATFEHDILGEVRRGEVRLG